jgi:hypothetical protein
VLGAVFLGISDHGERAGGEQTDRLGSISKQGDRYLRARSRP